LVATAGGAGACYGLVELIEKNAHPPEEVLPSGSDPYTARVPFK
jgi:hypothetical protein